MRSIILGISAYYHDSAAALLIDAKIIAAAQEERFTRQKHDSSFPSKAIAYVLSEAGLEVGDLQYIVFYDKPFLKFERLLETYHAFAPIGIKSFLKAVPLWASKKLFLKKTIREELSNLGVLKGKILFSEHHLSHAASAFFSSPFQSSAILTIDGVGEWATASIAIGKGNTIEILRELRFPHSIGLLYSAFTLYCGFKVNSGEYKLMGLAPYAKDSTEVNKIVRKIEDSLVDIREDGSILLNMDYFGYASGLRMTNDKKWMSLFGFPRRLPESEITSNYVHMAKAIQIVLEVVLIKLAKTTKRITQCDTLVMAGGVALNCVANGRLQREGIFNNIWIQPAAGDAGGALGCALAIYYMYLGKDRKSGQSNLDSMQGTYLGPCFSKKYIQNVLDRSGVSYLVLTNEELLPLIATKISKGMIVGWFQGRMEFGPRALGNRSILADARNTSMQQRLNLKIKYREGFRPFAPSILEEDAYTIFDLNQPSPYMLSTFLVKPAIRHNLPQVEGILDQLYQVRSKVPAITHVDYSARVQTVNKSTNPLFHGLISEFKKITGTPLLVNTSFNVRGEPIVCSPEDALNCFFSTEMDILVMGNFICLKTEQINAAIKPINKKEWSD